MLFFTEIGHKQIIIENFKKIDTFSKLYIFIINALIIGQDSTLFLGLNTHGTLHFVSNFYNSNPCVYQFLLCPQAWSISLELVFYIIAPIIVKFNYKLILLIIIVLLFSRILLYKSGLNYDPWTYRFLPLEFFFFLAGNISFKIYLYLKKTNPSKIINLIIFSILFFVIITFNYLNYNNLIKQYLFYTIFTLCIPFIFYLSKKSSIDRFIGELSYPVYLFHILIITYCFPVFYKIFGVFTSIITIVLTIVVSYLIVLFLIKPIDNYRKIRVNKNLT